MRNRIATFWIDPELDLLLLHARRQLGVNQSELIRLAIREVAERVLTPKDGRKRDMGEA